MKFRFKPLFTATITAVSLAALNIIPASADTLQVHAGDTMWKIAHFHHISLQGLERANPNVQPWNMQIGTVLKLPTQSASAEKQGHVAAHTARLAAHASAPQHAVAASGNTVTNQDVYWLSRLIHAEAVAEPYDAQVAVGDVVLHRVANPQYPNTVKGVIFQIANGHYQFTCVQNGFIYTQPTAENIQAAQAVLYGHKDLVPGADVFYNPSQTPANSWVRRQPGIKALGNFIFAK